MWSIVKTEAIVLRGEAYREADNRYQALTPFEGKLEFLGRGARKGRAKLAAHLEPFAVVDLELIRGARAMTVIGVERKEAFTHLANNIEHRLLAQAAAALVDRATRPDLEDQQLYKEFSSFLRFLNGSEPMAQGRNIFVLGGFLLRLMRLLGYDVELGACLSCKQEIMPLSFRWHEGRGGLVCSNCILAKPQEWFAARVMEEEIVTLLRFARDAGYGDLLRPSLKSEHVGSFAACVHDLFTFHVPGYAETPFWQAIIPDISPVALKEHAPLA